MASDTEGWNSFTLEDKGIVIRNHVRAASPSRPTDTSNARAQLLLSAAGPTSQPVRSAFTSPVRSNPSGSAAWAQQRAGGAHSLQKDNSSSLHSVGPTAAHGHTSEHHVAAPKLVGKHVAQRAAPAGFGKKAPASATPNWLQAWKSGYRRDNSRGRAASPTAQPQTPQTPSKTLNSVMTPGPAGFYSPTKSSARPSEQLMTSDHASLAADPLAIARMSKRALEDLWKAETGIGGHGETGVAPQQPRQAGAGARLPRSSSAPREWASTDSPTKAKGGGSPFSIGGWSPFRPQSPAPLSAWEVQKEAASSVAEKHVLTKTVLDSLNAGRRSEEELAGIRVREEAGKKGGTLPDSADNQRTSRGTSPFRAVLSTGPSTPRGVPPEANSFNLLLASCMSPVPRQTPTSGTPRQSSVPRSSSQPPLTQQFVRRNSDVAPVGQGADRSAMGPADISSADCESPRSVQSGAGQGYGNRQQEHNSNGYPDRNQNWNNPGGNLDRNRNPDEKWGQQEAEGEDDFHEAQEYPGTPQSVAGTGQEFSSPQLTLDPVTPPVTERVGSPRPRYNADGAWGRELPAPGDSHAWYSPVLEEMLAGSQKNSPGLEEMVASSWVGSGDDPELGPVSGQEGSGNAVGWQEGEGQKAMGKRQRPVSRPRGARRQILQQEEERKGQEGDGEVQSTRGAKGGCQGVPAAGATAHAYGSTTSGTDTDAMWDRGEGAVTMTNRQREEVRMLRSQLKRRDEILVDMQGVLIKYSDEIALLKKQMQLQGEAGGGHGVGPGWGEMAGLRRALLEESASKAGMKAELDTLRRALEEEAAMRAHMAAELADLRGRHVSSLGADDSSKREVDQLRALVEEANAAMVRAEAEMALVRRAFQEEAQSKGRALDEVSELRAALADERAKVGTLEGQLVGVTREAEALSSAKLGGGALVSPLPSSSAAVGQSRLRPIEAGAQGQSGSAAQGEKGKEGGVWLTKGQMHDVRELVKECRMLEAAKVEGERAMQQALNEQAEAKAEVQELRKKMKALEEQLKQQQEKEQQQHHLENGVLVQGPTDSAAAGAAVVRASGHPQSRGRAHPATDALSGGPAEPASQQQHDTSPRPAAPNGVYVGQQVKKFEEEILLRFPPAQVTTANAGFANGAMDKAALLPVGPTGRLQAQSVAIGSGRDAGSAEAKATAAVNSFQSPRGKQPLKVKGDAHPAMGSPRYESDYERFEDVADAFDALAWRDSSREVSDEEEEDEEEALEKRQRARELQALLDSAADSPGRGFGEGSPKVSAGSAASPAMLAASAGDWGTRGSHAQVVLAAEPASEKDLSELSSLLQKFAIGSGGEAANRQRKPRAQRK